MPEPGSSRPPLLILGASARAAASSAWRAGFAPSAVDLFADRDLVARFPADRVPRDDYPDGLERLARDRPDAPWLYTGAIENHPALVDRIALDRRLLGIGGDALRDVRDPTRWADALRREGLPALPCLVAGDGPPASGDWLLKPLASASGRGIRRWRVGEGAIPVGAYLQAEARGVALGACFVGDGSSARLAGVTRQILGRSDAGVRVVYRGGVGPWPVPREARRAIARVGEALASAFGLVGLFGVDLVLEGITPWPVEINPRYTASVELLEEATGVALLAEHARAFGIDSPSDARDAPPTSPAVAKLILRARSRAIAPDAWPWADHRDGRPIVADIPASGTVLEPGDPVLTVLARGPDVASATARLAARAALWGRRIAAWRVP